MPTPYRDPHIGHAWVAWQNYDMALRSGGQFNLIFDDLAYRLQKLDIQGYTLEGSMARWQEQIEWLGCKPDRVYVSSDNHAEHAAAWSELGIKPLRDTETHNVIDTPIMGGPWPPGAVADTYNPAFVAKWCVDDHIAHVDAFANGMQFVGERQLYDFLARRLGFRPVAQVHLPHIRRETASRKESKADGAPSLFTLRDAGFTPLQIISTLLECARRAEAKGLAEIIIPAGVLETEGEPQWIEFRLPFADSAKGFPEDDFHGDVQRAVKRRTADWRQSIIEGSTAHAQNG